MSMSFIAGLFGLGSLIGSIFGGSRSKQQTMSYAMPSASQQRTKALAMELPKAPDALAAGEDNAGAKAMEKAAEDEKKAAAARAAANNDIFTSPLGVVGEANTYRKKLLGVQ